MFKTCIEKQKSNTISPYFIVLDFESSNEKKCGSFDEKNEKIYSQLLKTANKAEKTVENSGLSMNLEVPPPPHPNNRDRYIIWKKRNIKRHVIPQSEATIFLYKKGYNLNEDYEAYQAIDLMNEINKSEGIEIENTEDKTIIFDNVYTSKDTNILRRKSVRCHQNIRPQVSNFENLSLPNIAKRRHSSSVKLNNLEYLNDNDNDNDNSNVTRTNSFNQRENYNENQNGYNRYIGYNYDNRCRNTFNSNFQSNNNIPTKLYPDLSSSQINYNISPNFNCIQENVPSAPIKPHTSTYPI